jgi:LIVCS family branched-chain amino acid:cation transporter
MTQTCLSHKQRLLVAGTLFGMFFGAGNLIFPVHLGQLAGRQFLPAAIGFILTAVGIPILGVAAIGSTHSEGLQDLSRRVGHRYSYFFTCLLYLTIGPFFAIPRCATTSFTAGVRPLLGTQLSEQTMLFLFSLIFFALVFVFSIRPGSITLWIGKIINPLFLLFLGVLIVTALLHPSIAVSGAVPDASYQNGAFFSALSQGYETMDAIAGLAFGIVVVSVIRQMGVQEDSAIAKEVLHSGMLADAGEKLGEVLSQVELHEPQIPYVANVTAQYVKSAAEVKELLTRQVSSSVRWQQSVEAMIADGVDTFIEIGPGKTLAGFMRKISRDVKTLNVEKLEDIGKVAEALKS